MVRPKQNLLQKLYSREVNGSFLPGRNPIHNMAASLFRIIPDRLVFCLKDVIQHMGNQIMLGTTRCGQFLITYSSFTTQSELWGHVFYTKYRLHWWAFRPGAPAVKVAEVQLFGADPGCPTGMTIGIAQWPGVNDKLIVFGEGSNEDEYSGLDQEDPDVVRRYYITVTTLPSLHNCRDCKAVAESFDEEQMAANWDSCVSLSCLKHGLTIHTTLEIAPPYPSFDFNISFKIDNKIIVNTSNFLHVLSFASDKEEIKPSRGDTIVPAELRHKLGEKLSDTLPDYICPWKKNESSLRSRKTLTRSMNNAWLNTIMDRAEKVYAFEEPEEGCELNQPRFKWYKRRRIADKMYEFCSDDEDMENICPPTKLPRYRKRSVILSPRRKRSLKSSKKGKPYEDYSSFESEEEELLLDSHDCAWPDFFTPNGSTMNSNSSADEDSSDSSWDEAIPTRTALSCKNSSVITNDQVGKENILTDRNSLKQIDVQNRTGQIDAISHDNVPSRLSCDSIISNECDQEVSKRLGEAVQRPTDIARHSNDPAGNVLDRVGAKSNCDNVNRLVSKEVVNKSASTSNNTQTDYNKIHPLNVSIINPDLSAILAEWEAESVSSLSPKSDIFPHKSCDSKNDAFHSFLERIPGVTISPQGRHKSRNSSQSTDSENNGVRLGENAHFAGRLVSPNSSVACKYPPLLVVLRTRNCNQEKDVIKQKEQYDSCKEANKSALKEDNAPRVKTGKDADYAMKHRMISGCSVQFDRIYIEVDEEIISTITDIEDDDQGTGFHCALPLSVHGSAYAQLQMVSSQKAEKMDIHCERVFQTSLDIEQFCFKASEIICKCEGLTFWFCNDYDVEIIDVCCLNGDILSVVVLTINAEKKPPKTEKYNKVNERFFYQSRCLFIWNPGSDRCWLEAYSQLIDVTVTDTANGRRSFPAVSAKTEAAALRSTIGPTSLFTFRQQPALRTFSHRLWNDYMPAPSLTEIRDHTNLIGFRLKPAKV